MYYLKNNYIDWLSNVKPILHSQDKLHWSWRLILLNVAGFDFLKRTFFNWGRADVENYIDSKYST